MGFRRRHRQGCTSRLARALADRLRRLDHLEQLTPSCTRRPDGHLITNCEACSPPCAHTVACVAAIANLSPAFVFSPELTPRDRRATGRAGIFIDRITVGARQIGT